MTISTEQKYGALSMYEMLRALEKYCDDKDAIHGHFIFERLEAVCVYQVNRWHKNYELTRGEETWEGPSIERKRWQATLDTVQAARRRFVGVHGKPPKTHYKLTVCEMKYVCYDEEMG